MTEEKGFDSIDDIINNGVAKGFRGNKNTIDSFEFIVITDGDSKTFIGDISHVEAIENETKIPRVNISFINSRLFDSGLLSDIDWSSNNVRHRNINL